MHLQVQFGIREHANIAATIYLKRKADTRPDLSHDPGDEDHISTSTSTSPMWLYPAPLKAQQRLPQYPSLSICTAVPTSSSTSTAPRNSTGPAIPTPVPPKPRGAARPAHAMPKCLIPNTNPRIVMTGLWLDGAVLRRGAARRVTVPQRGTWGGRDGDGERGRGERGLWLWLGVFNRVGCA